VGKSSIINAIFKSENLTEVGDLSAKIERGKQTTRLVSLYKVGNGYLADTAGFSLLDLSFVSDLKKEELASYYPDFLEGRKLCRYRSCLHEGGECGVIKLVREGKISKRRF
jgi:ribosome biogenesis GTPase